MNYLLWRNILMVKGIGENRLFDFSYFLVFLDEMGFFLM